MNDATIETLNTHVHYTGAKTISESANNQPPKNYTLFLFQKNNQLIFKPITVCQNLTIQKIPNSQNQKNRK